MPSILGSDLAGEGEGEGDAHQIHDVSVLQAHLFIFLGSELSLIDIHNLTCAIEHGQRGAHLHASCQGALV